MPSPRSRIYCRAAWILLAAWAVGAGLPPGLAAAGLPAAHRLAVELIPAENRLIARDDIRISLDDRPELFFQLTGRAAGLEVEVDGRPRAFRFVGSELALSIAPHERGRTVEVGIRYTARFDDPVPQDPLNTDNPGFGVNASISESGVFLMPGAGWYPSPADGEETFAVKVIAPAGILAVTAGRGVGHETRDGRTVSEWRIEHPVRGLSLSAAAYELHAREFGDVAVAAYLLPENRDLAPAYLEASLGYLKLYTELFGPYPFPKFAVVENFFPTGYGFPSYTLIGGKVLRLPFILSTSLGHEIAHCWWGNGVLVDYDAGNWSEALTTYVSDYLYRERESAAAGADYRRQALLNFSALVPPAKDLPLSRFAARTDPLTKAVGYDKGVMVFHMLRRRIGEEAFWGGLRDVFRDFRFKPASWEDFRKAFERRSGLALSDFFAQWVSWRGAPRLALEDVRRERTPEGWRVTGRVAQSGPAYGLELDLVLDTASGAAAHRLAVQAAHADFEIMSPAEPERLALDPEHHLMRRMAPSEIPPSVNALKSSPAVLFVLSGRLPAETAGRLADILALSLGIRPAAVVPEAELGGRRLDAHDVLFVGLPRSPEQLGPAPEGLEIRESGYALNGEAHTDPADALFGVFHHPRAPGRVLALYWPLAPAGAEAAAAKITHYGRYSYLSFRDGRNTQKGTWPPVGAPVEYRWPKGAN